MAPAPKAVASLGTVTEADVDSLSVKDLRAHLAQLGVNSSGCIEKGDFQRLLKSTLAARKAGPGSAAGPRPALRTTSGAPGPALAATGAASTSVGAPPVARASAGGGATLDLPDAWSVTGFQSFKPATPNPSAPSSIPAPSPAYAPIRQAAPQGTLVSGGDDLPLSEQVGMVPLIPRAGLGTAVPFVCVAPVLTEIDGTSYSALCPVVSGDRCSDPFPASAAIGSKRYFELLLRPDVSTQAVLNAFASAGTSLGLDGVANTKNSVLLEQRVTMLQSTFKEHGLANSSAPSTGGSVAPIPVKGLVRKVSSALDRMTPAGRRPSTTPGAAGAAGAASAPAASSSSSFFKPSTVTYVNSLAVTVTVNDSNDRVALLLAGRFMPDPKKDDFHGRLVDKTAMGASTSPSSSSTSALDVLGLGDSSSSGISCSCPLASVIGALGAVAPDSSALAARRGSDVGTTARRESDASAGALAGAGVGAGPGGVSPTSGGSSGPGAPVAGAGASLYVRPTRGKTALMQTLALDNVRAEVPPWVTLRTHFAKLKVEGDVPTSADPFALFTFSVDDIEDDLVRLVVEVTARLRTATILGESLWTEAFDTAKRELASGTIAVDTSTVAVHGDYSAAVSVAARAQMAKELEVEVAPFKARAAKDQATLTAVHTAVSLVHTQSKVPVPPAPTPTDASAVVAVLPGSEEVVCLTKEELLEVLQALGVAVDEETMADEDALREAARKGIVTKRQRFEARVTEDSVVTALQPEDCLGRDGRGLTPAEQLAKRVYRIATAIVTRCGDSVNQVVHATAVATNDEKEVLADQCRRQVAVQCSGAFRNAVALVLASPGECPANPDIKVLASADMSSEVPIVGCNARVGAKMGRLVVTPTHILFHSSILGFKFTKAVPLRRLSAITMTSTLVTTLINLTFVEEVKAAAAAVDVDDLLGVGVAREPAVATMVPGELELSVTQADAEGLCDVARLCRQRLLYPESDYFIYDTEDTLQLQDIILDEVLLPALDKPTSPVANPAAAVVDVDPFASSAHIPVATFAGAGAGAPATVSISDAFSGLM